MRTANTLVLFLSIAGGIVFALAGWYIADLISYSTLPFPLNNSALIHLVLTLVPGVTVFVLLPIVLRQPVASFIEQISHASAAQIIADFIGFTMGLLIAALLAFPLALLPDPFRQVLPLLCAVILAYVGVLVMNVRYREFFAILNIRVPGNKTEERAAEPEAVSTPPAKQAILLDSSVIIDGRIADVSETGFIRSELVVPRFVLNEVQHIADSSDGLRRARGRRGLEVLKRLQKESPTPVRIVDVDLPGTREVDEQLTTLAKQWSCPIMTNDYNLNKVASLQGVTVLNVNELANAVKAAVLPGETLEVHIIQEGKELGQGVGYLDDGTMIVVEDGREYLNRDVIVVVTKVLQTAAGRMIFAKP